MGSEDLQAWIEAVDRVQTQDLPSREEMRAVARDVGLDESILDRAAEHAEELKLQGTRFLENGLPAEAVGVLEKARALEPWSLDILATLGRAHLELYRQSGSAQAREAADRLARLLIAENADDPAGYALLKDLSARRSTPRWVLAAAIGGLGLGLGLAGFLAVRDAPSATTPLSNVGTTAPAPTVRVGELDIQIVRGALPDGVDVEVTQTKVVPTNTGEGWLVNLGAVLRNTAPLVIQEAVGTVQALDSAGKPLASADLGFVESHDPAIYQGDRTDAELYLRGTNAVGQPASLVIEITRLQAEPGTRGVGDPVPLSWGVDQPTSVDVSVTRREGGQCSPSLTRVHCGGIFVVTNTGTTPIEILKLAAHFGDSGRSVETYAIASSGRALGPGEQQPFRVASAVDSPAPEGAWRFEVVSVRTP